MSDYSNHTDQMIAIFPKLNKEVFNFDLDPDNHEFQKVFSFYKVTLSENSFYGITPCFLFFRNDTSINAHAAKAADKYLVAINSGTITQLSDLFKTLDTNKTLNLISLDISKLGTSLNAVMLQFCYHFTFYHEMAHLIQKSEYLEGGLNEIPIKKEPYDERRHLLELDADAFSAISLSEHIIQLLEENYRVFNKEDIIDIFALLSATAFNYVLTFNSGSLDLYTYDLVHPHPIIRISYIITNLLSYAAQRFGTDIITMQIKKAIISKAIMIGKIVFSKDIMIRYERVLKEHKKEIEAYISHFDNLAERDESLALAKWNAGIEVNRKGF
jgi:hypothetical protein